MSEAMSEFLSKIGLKDILCPTCIYCKSIDYDGTVHCMLFGRTKLKIYCSEYEMDKEVSPK
jgi:ferredoxin-thioredoxin reductase catalytic subunit